MQIFIQNLVKLDQIHDQKIVPHWQCGQYVTAIYSMFKKWIKLYCLFLCMGFNCLKAAEPLNVDSLLFFFTKSPEISCAHLIDLGKMKGWVDLGVTQWFWTWDLWILNPVLEPLVFTFTGRNIGLNCKLCFCAFEGNKNSVTNLCLW